VNIPQNLGSKAKLHCFPFIKTLQNFIYQHLADLKNVQSIENTEKFKECQVNTNKLDVKKLSILDVKNSLSQQPTICNRSIVAIVRCVLKSESQKIARLTAIA
jgi:hypothetical protein